MATDENTTYELVIQGIDGNYELISLNGNDINAQQKVSFGLQLSNGDANIYKIKITKNDNGEFTVNKFDVSADGTNYTNISINNTPITNITNDTIKSLFNQTSTGGSSKKSKKSGKKYSKRSRRVLRKSLKRKH